MHATQLGSGALREDLSLQRMGALETLGKLTAMGKMRFPPWDAASGVGNFGSAV